LNDELSEIVDIDKEVFEQFWDRKRYESIVNNPQYTIHKIWAAKKIVGFAVSLDMIDTLEVIRIGVFNSCKRHGYGQKLMQKIESQAWKLNKPNIFLEVRSKNEAAINLYKKLGFEVVTIRKNYYSNDMDDALVMRKRIGVNGNE